MHNFKELKVWQKARVMVKDVYLMTQPFPKEELFGLTSQMRRSAVSIAANIAEGCGRGTNAQLAHFLDIAQGSSCELETLIILALDLGYITDEVFFDMSLKVNEIQRMNIGFKNTLGIK